MIAAETRVRIRPRNSTGYMRTARLGLSGNVRLEVTAEDLIGRKQASLRFTDNLLRARINGRSLGWTIGRARCPQGAARPARASPAPLSRHRAGPADTAKDEPSLCSASTKAWGEHDEGTGPLRCRLPRPRPPAGVDPHPAHRDPTPRGWSFTWTIASTLPVASIASSARRDWSPG